MFFEQEREHFFRPLMGKYREQVVECLRELYKRLYSASNADYGQALARDTLVDIFQEALVRAPKLATPDGLMAQGEETRFRNEREQSVWVLNVLLEHGWIEKQVDQATLSSTFAMTRFGRQFTEPFIHEQRELAHTRHRNTRNTRNALESFAERGDIYDLLDAYEFSERIISDFTDVIAELEERKRDLVREMEDQRLLDSASSAFFDFMENRFQPDLSVRLSADNVEKHRDQISRLITRIRKRDKAFKADAERKLRERLPELVKPQQSILWHLLDGIDLRMRNASDVMLPALRRSLQSFTKRADIIIRQMSYLASSQHNDVVSVCKHLASLSQQEQAQRLEAAGVSMAVPSVELLDPASVRLAPPRVRQTWDDVLDDDSDAFDVNARKDIYIQQVLDQAFLVNQSAVRNYMIQHLKDGNKISTRDLPITSAQDFLAVSHAIGLGAADGLSSEFSFYIEYEQAFDAHEHEQHSDFFLTKDHFTFQLVHD